jgi:hypothetical protein
VMGKAGRRRRPSNIRTQARLLWSEKLAWCH